jgi:hypothetical protein
MITDDKVEAAREAMRMALHALVESRGAVNNTLNQYLLHAGWPKYDGRIGPATEQLAKHDAAITALRAAMGAKLAAEAERDTLAALLREALVLLARAQAEHEADSFPISNAVAQAQDALRAAMGAKNG